MENNNKNKYSIQDFDSSLDLGPLTSEQKNQNSFEVFSKKIKRIQDLDFERKGIQSSIESKFLDAHYSSEVVDEQTQENINNILNLVFLQGNNEDLITIFNPDRLNKLGLDKNGFEYKLKYAMYLRAQLSSNIINNDNLSNDNFANLVKEFDSRISEITYDLLEVAKEENFENEYFLNLKNQTLKFDESFKAKLDIASKIMTDRIAKYELNEKNGVGFEKNILQKTLDFCSQKIYSQADFEYYVEQTKNKSVSENTKFDTNSFVVAGTLFKNDIIKTIVEGDKSSEDFEMLVLDAINEMLENLQETENFININVAPYIVIKDRQEKIGEYLKYKKEQEGIQVLWNEKSGQVPTEEQFVYYALDRFTKLDNHESEWNEMSKSLIHKVSSDEFESNALQSVKEYTSFIAELENLASKYGMSDYAIKTVEDAVYNRNKENIDKWLYDVASNNQNSMYEKNPFLSFSEVDREEITSLKRSLNSRIAYARKIDKDKFENLDIEMYANKAIEKVRSFFNENGLDIALIESKINNVENSLKEYLENISEEKYKQRVFSDIKVMERESNHIYEQAKQSQVNAIFDLKDYALNTIEVMEDALKENNVTRLGALDTLKEQVLEALEDFMNNPEEEKYKQRLEFEVDKYKNRCLHEIEEAKEKNKDQSEFDISVVAEDIYEKIDNFVNKYHMDVDIFTNEIENVNSIKERYESASDEEKDAIIDEMFDYSNQVQTKIEELDKQESEKSLIDIDTAYKDILEDFVTLEGKGIDSSRFAASRNELTNFYQLYKREDLTEADYIYIDRIFNRAIKDAALIVTQSTEELNRMSQEEQSSTPGEEEQEEPAPIVPTDEVGLKNKKQKKKKGKHDELDSSFKSLGKNGTKKLITAGRILGGAFSLLTLLFLISGAWIAALVCTSALTSYAIADVSVTRRMKKEEEAQRVTSYDDYTYEQSNEASNERNITQENNQEAQTKVSNENVLSENMQENENVVQAETGNTEENLTDNVVPEGNELVEETTSDNGQVQEEENSQREGEVQEEEKVKEESESQKEENLQKQEEIEQEENKLKDEVEEVEFPEKVNEQTADNADEKDFENSSKTENNLQNTEQEMPEEVKQEITKAKYQERDYGLSM